MTGFVAELRARKVTPHIAIDAHLTKTGKRRKTAIDRRTLRHPGYEVSQRCRKRIEEVFGWIKGSAGLAKVKLRGRARVDAAFTLAFDELKTHTCERVEALRSKAPERVEQEVWGLLLAYNLVRLPKLLAAPT